MLFLRFFLLFFFAPHSDNLLKDKYGWRLQFYFISKKKIHQQQSFPKFEENKNKQQATYPKIWKN